MTNKETLAFCQWLMQHRLITAETATRVMAAADCLPQELLQFLDKHKKLAKPAAEVWPVYQHARSVQSGRQTVVPQRGAQQVRSVVDTHGLGESSQGLHHSQVGQAPAAVPPPNAPSTQSARVAAPAVQKYGRFIVERELGKGNMGIVYLGLDATLGRKVAIKVIQVYGSGGPDQDELEKFIKEAQAMAQVSHGNVVVIYDAGMEGNVPYLAMQYVEGAKTLDEAACEAANDEEILRIFCQLVQGVAALHEKGIVHRDLKPDNAMVEAATGRVLVMDLGVALAAGQEASDQGGTPVYMSPEQAIGLPNLTQSSDVYALGRLLLRMLFCDPDDKFAGLIHMADNMMALMRSIVAEETADGPPGKIREMMGGKYPEELILIVEKCFQPKPENRYQTAGELHEALLGYFDIVKEGKLLKEEKIKQRARERERELAEQKQQTKRVQLFAGIAIAVLFLILGLTLWGLHQSNKAEEQAVAKAKAEQKTAETAQELAAAKQKEIEAQKIRVEVSRRMFTAQTYIDAAEWGSAEKVLADIVEKDPEFIPALWSYAEVLYNRLDHRSIEAYKKIVELVPSPEKKARAQFWVLYIGLDLGAMTEEDAPVLLAEIEPGMYRDLAESYFSVHQFSKNRLAGREAQAASDRYKARGDFEKADTARSKALRDQEQGQVFLERATMLLNRQNGDHWLVAWLYGFLLMQTEPAKAEAYLTKSINKNPAFPMTWYYRSLMLMGPPFNDPISAVRDSERLRVLMPGWPKGHLQRARSYLALAEKNKHDISFFDAKMDDAFEVLADWKNWDAKADFVEAKVVFHRVYFHYRKMHMRLEIGRADLAAQEKLAVLREFEYLKAAAGKYYGKLDHSYQAQAQKIEAEMKNR